MDDAGFSLLLLVYTLSLRKQLPRRGPGLRRPLGQLGQSVQFLALDLSGDFLDRNQRIQEMPFGDLDADIGTVVFSRFYQ